MAIKTRVELHTLIESYLADNTSGEISAADVRALSQDIIDSADLIRELEQVAAERLPQDLRILLEGMRLVGETTTPAAHIGSVGLDGAISARGVLIPRGHTPKPLFEAGGSISDDNTSFIALLSRDNLCRVETLEPLTLVNGLIYNGTTYTLTHGNLRDSTFVLDLQVYHYSVTTDLALVLGSSHTFSLLKADGHLMHFGAVTGIVLGENITVSNASATPITAERVKTLNNDADDSNTYTNDEKTKLGTLDIFKTNLVTDANTATEPGLYEIANLATAENVPPALIGKGQLLVSNTGGQTLISLSRYSIYFRNNSTQLSWGSLNTLTLNSLMSSDFLRAGDTRNLNTINSRGFYNYHSSSTGLDNATGGGPGCLIQTCSSSGGTEQLLLPIAGGIFTRSSYLGPLEDQPWVRIDIGGLTGLTVKTLNESQPDTNPFTDDEKSKLETIDADANVNIEIQGLTSSTSYALNNTTNTAVAESFTTGLKLPQLNIYLPVGDWTGLTFWDNFLIFLNDTTNRTYWVNLTTRKHDPSRDFFLGAGVWTGLIVVENSLHCLHGGVGSHVYNLETTPAARRSSLDIDITVLSPRPAGQYEWGYAHEGIIRLGTSGGDLIGFNAESERRTSFDTDINGTGPAQVWGGGFRANGLTYFLEITENQLHGYYDTTAQESLTHLISLGTGTFSGATQGPLTEKENIFANLPVTTPNDIDKFPFQKQVPATDGTFEVTFGTNAYQPQTRPGYAKAVSYVNSDGVVTPVYNEAGTLSQPIPHLSALYLNADNRVAIALTRNFIGSATGRIAFQYTVLDGVIEDVFSLGLDLNTDDFDDLAEQYVFEEPAPGELTDATERAAFDDNRTIIKATVLLSDGRSISPTTLVQEDTEAILLSELKNIFGVKDGNANSFEGNPLSLFLLGTNGFKTIPVRPSFSDNVFFKYRANTENAPSTAEGLFFCFGLSDQNNSVLLELAADINGFYYRVGLNDTTSTTAILWTSTSDTGAELLAAIKDIDIDGHLGINAGTFGGLIPSAYIRTGLVDSIQTFDNSSRFIDYNDSDTMLDSISLPSGPGCAFSLPCAPITVIDGVLVGGDVTQIAFPVSGGIYRRDRLPTAQWGTIPFVSIGGNTGAQILEKLLLVDGNSSGLDADLLDGRESSRYLHASTVTTIGMTPIQNLNVFGGYAANTANAPTTNAGFIFCTSSLSSGTTSQLLERAFDSTGYYYRLATLADTLVVPPVFIPWVGPLGVGGTGGTQTGAELLAAIKLIDRDGSLGINAGEFDGQTSDKYLRITDDLELLSEVTSDSRVYSYNAHASVASLVSLPSGPGCCINMVCGIDGTASDPTAKGVSQIVFPQAGGIYRRERLESDTWGPALSQVQFISIGSLTGAPLLAAIKDIDVNDSAGINAGTFGGKQIVSFLRTHSQNVPNLITTSISNTFFPFDILTESSSDTYGLPLGRGCLFNMYCENASSAIPQNHTVQIAFPESGGIYRRSRPDLDQWGTIKFTSIGGDAAAGILTKLKTLDTYNEFTDELKEQLEAVESELTEELELISKNSLVERGATHTFVAFTDALAGQSDYKLFVRTTGNQQYRSGVSASGGISLDNSLVAALATLVLPTPESFVEATDKLRLVSGIKIADVSYNLAKYRFRLDTPSEFLEHTLVFAYKIVGFAGFEVGTNYKIELVKEDGDVVHWGDFGRVIMNDNIEATSLYTPEVTNINTSLAKYTHVTAYEAGTAGAVHADAYGHSLLLAGHEGAGRCRLITDNENEDLYLQFSSASTLASGIENTTKHRVKVESDYFESTVAEAIDGFGVIQTAVHLLGVIPSFSWITLTPVVTDGIYVAGVEIPLTNDFRTGQEGMAIYMDDLRVSFEFGPNGYRLNHETTIRPEYTSSTGVVTPTNLTNWKVKFHAYR